MRLSPPAEHTTLPAMTTPPPMNHVFVDFENVHEIDPAVLECQGLTVTLLLGPVKKKLDLAVVEQLVGHAAAVQFVRLATKGKNAVDFALAYDLGQAVLADPTACLHIVSNDKGYDPLVEHLHAKHVRVRRHGDFASLLGALTARPVPPPNASAPRVAPVPASVVATPAPKPTPAKPVLSEGAAHLHEILASSVSRPRTRKTLTRHAITVLGNKIDEGQASRLIQELTAAGKIAINAQDKVDYRFPVPRGT